MKKNKNQIKGMTTALILSMMLTQGIPILTVKARDSTNVSYSCGDEATTCPTSISGSVNSSSLGNLEGSYGPMTISSYVQEVTSWTGDAITEMPTATRPGYTFKGWKSSQSESIIDWDTSLMKDHATFGSNVDLDLIAVWEPAASNNESSIPIQLTRPSTPINVTLPSSIDLLFDGSNVNALAEKFIITNNSNIGNLKISNLSATLKDTTWTLKSETTEAYYMGLPLDSRELYLGFSTDGFTFSALNGSGINPGMILAPKERLSFQIEAKTGGSNTKIEARLIDIELTIGYQKQKIETGPSMTKEEATALGYTLVKLNDGTYAIGGDRTSTLSGDIEIPRSIDGILVTQLDSYGFIGNKKITSAIIPNSVTTLGDSAFSSCTNLKSVMIPESVTSIENMAFFNCSNLKAVHLPESLTEIGTIAFSGSGITQLYIPRSVTNIVPGAFSSSDIVSLNVDPSNPRYRSADGVVFSKDMAVLIAFLPKNSNTSYIIPNSVTTIGDQAFYGSKNLNSVIIPESVMTIGDQSFSDCTSLSDLKIPTSVTHIGNRSFKDVNHITYLGSASGSPWGAKTIN